MTLDEVPRVSRRKRSRKRRRARKVRRYTQAIGWSLLGLILSGIVIASTIYVVLSMRSGGSAVPVTRPVNPGYAP